MSIAERGLRSKGYPFYTLTIIIHLVKRERSSDPSGECGPVQPCERGPSNSARFLHESLREDTEICSAAVGSKERPLDMTNKRFLLLRQHPVTSCHHMLNLKSSMSSNKQTCGLLRCPPLLGSESTETIRLGKEHLKYQYHS